ncbi:MAG TPA: hypothetical protein VG273_16580 [Bryobacteraceae bacterium]|jgi:hypothetical protein|nr:hypothetical protein [Bryobacteraceae bacterium]
MGGFQIGLGGSPGAAASALSGLQEAVAQRARLAQQEKEKQAEEQQKGLQNDFENQLKLTNAGYVPADVYANGGPPPGRPTLMTPEANPDADTSAGTITTPSGQKYAKSKTGKLDESNSFVISPTVAQALGEYGVDAKAGDRFPLAHSQLAVEAMKAHLGKTSLDDSNSVTITQDMADKLKPHGISIKPGARVSIEKAQDLKDLVNIGEPAEKPGKGYQFSYHQDDDGNVTVLRGDPESGDVSTVKTFKGVGTKRKDPNAPPKASAAQLRTIESEKARALTKAKDEYQKSVTSALTDDDKRAAATRLKQDFQDAQNSYEASIADVTGAKTGHNDWADKLGGPSPDSPQSGTQNAAGSQKAPSQLSTGHKVGDTVQLKSGKTVRIKKINANGTFEAE